MRQPVLSMYKLASFAESNVEAAVELIRGEFESRYESKMALSSTELRHDSFRLNTCTEGSSIDWRFSLLSFGCHQMSAELWSEIGVSCIRDWAKELVQQGCFDSCDYWVPRGKTSFLSTSKFEVACFGKIEDLLLHFLMSRLDFMDVTVQVKFLSLFEWLQTSGPSLDGEMKEVLVADYSSDKNIVSLFRTATSEMTKEEYERVVTMLPADLYKLAR